MKNSHPVRSRNQKTQKHHTAFFELLRSLPDYLCRPVSSQVNPPSEPWQTSRSAKTSALYVTLNPRMAGKHISEPTTPNREKFTQSTEIAQIDQPLTEHSFSGAPARRSRTGTQMLIVLTLYHHLTLRYTQHAQPVGGVCQWEWLSRFSSS